MIFDKLENADFYTSISDKLKKGIEFLKNNNFSTLEPGKYEIDGENVYATISEYSTKNHQDCLPEVHQIYTDIQYMVSGREVIGYAALKNQAIEIPYDLENDIAFLSAETSPIILNPGMIAIFFPHDIHRPGMQIDGPEMVKKVVVKVKLDLNQD